MKNISVPLTVNSFPTLHYRRKTKNIFLVENNEDDQFYFIDALSQIDDTVLYDVANNGYEALKKLEHTGILPDIIFMEVNLPLMNGLQCLSAIMKNSLTKDIPVILISNENEYAEFACSMGAKGFIKKPKNAKVFRLALELMINAGF